MTEKDRHSAKRVLKKGVQYGFGIAFRKEFTFEKESSFLKNTFWYSTSDFMQGQGSMDKKRGRVLKKRVCYIFGIAFRK